MTLANLKPKQKGVVVKVDLKGGFAKRLAEMGVGKGALVEFVRVGPFGSPIVIRAKGSNLIFSKDQATNIIIEEE